MAYKILETKTENDAQSMREQFALDVLMGFSSKHKYLPSKYFYDDRGSELFSKITETPEYYPTQCEFNILQSKGRDIAQSLGQTNMNIVELGAGDGRKTLLFLRQLLENQQNFEYHPIDISEYAIEKLDQTLKRELPELSHQGLVGEYFVSLKWIKENKKGKNVILFLGSNIGNFHLAQALVFLRSLWKNLNHGDQLLIGFDLKKDIDVLLWAYNDRSGFTRDFNLNILERINRELGGHFDLKNFQHFGTYNPHIGAMESYLISLCQQDVIIDELEKGFRFRAYEPIHLEYSYKYLEEDIAYLAKESGFSIQKNFYDQKKFYINSLWQVEKTY